MTERRPYTEYISLYHDLSPDNQPLQILEEMKKDPPKVIIFLRFSDEIEQFHENLYRGHISGQRQLRDYIDYLLMDGRYVIVSQYKLSKFLDIYNFPEELKDTYNRINKNSSETETKDFVNKITKFIKIKNSFIAPDCNLLVLVRHDLIKD